MVEGRAEDYYSKSETHIQHIFNLFQTTWKTFYLYHLLKILFWLQKLKTELNWEGGGCLTIDTSKHWLSSPFQSCNGNLYLHILSSTRCWPSKMYMYIIYLTYNADNVADFQIWKKLCINIYNGLSAYKIVYTPIQYSNFFWYKRNGTLPNHFVSYFSFVFASTYFIGSNKDSYVKFNKYNKFMELESPTS